MTAINRISKQKEHLTFITQGKDKDKSIANVVPIKSQTSVIHARLAFVLITNQMQTSNYEHLTIR